MSLSEQRKAVPDDLRKSLLTSIIQGFPHPLVLLGGGGEGEKQEKMWFHFSFVSQNATLFLVASKLNYFASSCFGFGCDGNQ